MTRVTAPSRLHFGLLHVPTESSTGSIRKFGGIGLMIDQPGIVVAARPADSWQFEGMLASRAQIFAHRFMASLEKQPRPLQVLVERCPAEHTGLGVGTQLGLAIGKVLAIELGLPKLSSVEIAVRVGRGERSAIGVHGFDRGGLIVEPGKLPGEAISPLLRCIPLPDAWRIAVFMPHTQTAWHGPQEEQAFAKAGARSEKLGEVMQCILPATEAGKFEEFSESVHEFNRVAGEPFAAVQGGTYSSTEVADLIAKIRQLGVKGVGQSSWGPAVFAILESQDRAAWLVQQLLGTVRGWIAKQSTGHHVERA